MSQGKSRLPIYEDKIYDDYKFYIDCYNFNNKAIASNSKLKKELDFNQMGHFLVLLCKNIRKQNQYLDIIE